MISDEQLEEWERLEREATEGPWEAWGSDSLPPMWWVRTVDGGDSINATGYDGEMEKADALFTAASRSAVPALIAGVRRLRAALKVAGDACREAEWKGEGGFWEEACCPVCGADPHRTPKNTHEDDCALATTLRVTSGRVRLPGDASDDEETKA